MDKNSPPLALQLSVGLGPAGAGVRSLVDRLRRGIYGCEGVRRTTKALPLCHEAADVLDVSLAVCIRQEQIIMDREREIAQLRTVLRQVGDRAHDASTGPAVPDVLWEIRGIAYDVL